MISLRPYINGVLVVLAGTPFLLAADNGVKVETLSNDQPREVPFQTPVDDEAQSTKMGGELAYQLQVLQQEMRQLRGMVEDLQHQVKQVESTQQNRYLDLDKRIQDLQQQVAGGQPGSSTASAGTGPGGESSEISDVNKEEPVASKSTDEKEVYEKALDLIRKRQYDDAITQLKSVIAQYPNGDFTANAYYWLGEVYAALPQPDYEKARQALAQVTTYFPNSRKVPDATYKLGKVYFYMGDCKRARDALNQVVKNYPGKSVAKLAESFLHDNVHCQD